MDAGRAMFLLVAIATHALVGYALVRTFTEESPALGALWGVAPDADFLLPDWGFPLVHRGITHTPAALLVVAGVAALAGRRRLASAVVLAAGAHLLVDSLTTTGIMWLYPLSTEFFAVDLDAHRPAGTALLWAASLGLLVRSSPETSSDR